MTGLEPNWDCQEAKEDEISRLSWRALPAPLLDAMRGGRDRAMWPFDRRIDTIRAAIGTQSARQARDAATLRDAEFRCFSQWNEDGLIQWLIARVPIADRSFVEFGVEDYRESNTRFLLHHDNWRGLILDRGSAHRAFIVRSGLRWRHSIEARTATITTENINSLLADQPEDLGLLSVDIDGMDYWILSAIDRIRPRIVVVEYNSLFGAAAMVSVPYTPDFDRRKAHHSMLYFGASLAAFDRWGRQAAYRLVGCESHGANAFFVRNDVAGSLSTLTPEEAWVESRFRQSRGPDGRATYVSGMAAQRALIRNLPLVDVTTGETIAVGDL